MTTDVKFLKLLDCLNKLVSKLREHQKIPVHNRINQFYYMQQIEELKLAEQQLNDAVKRVKFFEELRDKKYQEIFLRWSKDARWLNQHLMREQHSKCQGLDVDRKVVL